jgi:hypothetical protein
VGSNPTSPTGVNPIVITTLRLAGLITIVAGIVCGLLITPALFAIALIGVSDLVIARMFASGKLGQPKPEDSAAAAEADPAYNPYARED